MKKIIVLFIAMLFVLNSCNNTVQEEGFIKVDDQQVLKEVDDNTTDPKEQVKTEDLNNSDDNKEDDEEDEESNLITDDNELIFKTEDGESKIIVNKPNGDGWCVPGTNWEMTTTTSTGIGYTKWEVERIVTDINEVKGFCEASYRITNPDGTKSEEYYYYSEDGSKLYMKTDSGYVEVAYPSSS